MSERTMPATASTIPARLDRLPWSAWHWKVVIALGVSWLLDGLEVTVVGSLGPALQRPETLGLSAGQIGWAASAYIAGAVLGALYFGRLADKLGRKRMFLVTLVVYLVATMMTAFTWDIASFAFCRFLTGFGIGGEYAAINSAIDELIPARLRGRRDGVPALPQAHRARAGAVHRPGVPPRRGVLHPGAGAEHLLQGRRRRRAALHRAVRGRQRARPGPARPPVRHRRPAQDDHPLLRRLRGAADRHGAAVQRRGAVGGDADRLLDGGVLLRLGRRQRRLPDRQRDLPDGD